MEDEDALQSSSRSSAKGAQRGGSRASRGCCLREESKVVSFGPRSERRRKRPTKVVIGLTGTDVGEKIVSSSICEVVAVLKVGGCQQKVEKRKTKETTTTHDVQGKKHAAHPKEHFPVHLTHRRALLPVRPAEGRVEVFEGFVARNRSVVGSEGTVEDGFLRSDLREE
jgi:hypothetical protein